MRCCFVLGCLVLVSHGFRTTVVSRGEGPDPRSNFADSIGATFLSVDHHSPDAIAEQVGTIDLVYEATGASSLAFKMLERLGTNGVFILTGEPGQLLAGVGREGPAWALYDVSES